MRVDIARFIPPSSIPLALLIATLCAVGAPAAAFGTGGWWSADSPFYEASARVSERGMEEGIWRPGDPFAVDVPTECEHCGAPQLQAELPGVAPLNFANLHRDLMLPSGGGVGVDPAPAEGGDDVLLWDGTFTPLAPVGGNRSAGSDGPEETTVTCVTAVTALKVAATALFDCDKGISYAVDCRVTDGYTCATQCSNTNNACTDKGECSDNQDCTRGDTCSKFKDCTASQKECTKGPDCSQGDSCTEGDNCSSGWLCTFGDDCSRGDDCTESGTCSSGGGCTRGEDCSNQSVCTKKDQCSKGILCSKYNDACTPGKRGRTDGKSSNLVGRVGRDEEGPVFAAILPEPGEPPRFSAAPALGLAGLLFALALFATALRRTSRPVARAGRWLGLVTGSLVLILALALAWPAAAQGGTQQQIAAAAAQAMQWGAQPSAATQQRLAAWRQLYFGAGSPAEYQALVDGWVAADGPAVLAELLFPYQSGSRRALHRFALAALADQVGSKTLESALADAFRNQGGKPWVSEAATEWWMEAGALADAQWVVQQSAQDAQSGVLPNDPKLARGYVAQAVVLGAKLFPASASSFGPLVAGVSFSPHDQLAVDAATNPTDDTAADALVQAILDDPALKPDAVNALSDGQLERVLINAAASGVGDATAEEIALWESTAGELLRRDTVVAAPTLPSLQILAEDIPMVSAQALLARSAPESSWWKLVGELRPGTMGPLLVEYLRPEDALRRWWAWHGGSGASLASQTAEATEMIVAMSEVWNLQGGFLGTDVTPEVSAFGAYAADFQPVVDFANATLPDPKVDPVADVVLQSARSLAQQAASMPVDRFQVSIATLATYGVPAAEKFALSVNFSILPLLVEESEISAAYSWFDRLPGNQLPSGYEPMSDAFLLAARAYGQVGRDALWNQVSAMAQWADEDISADAAHLLSLWAGPADGKALGRAARGARGADGLSQLLVGMSDFARRNPTKLSALGDLLQAGVESSQWRLALESTEILVAVLCVDVYEINEKAIHDSVVALLEGLDRSKVDSTVDREIQNAIERVRWEPSQDEPQDVPQTPTENVPALGL